MMANTLQSPLPWMGLDAEDRRFRRILVQVLTICLVIGGIVPTVTVPLVEPETALVLPPRLVRIIADRTVPAAPPPAASQSAPQKPASPPPPKPSQPVVQKPVTVAGPEPQEAPRKKSQPASPVPTPRQRAAQAGVLAMSDALGELRSIAPKTTAAGTRAPASAGGSGVKTQKPSLLAADVTRGSSGIDGGVAYQSVLGPTGLPAKSGGSGQDISEDGGNLSVTRSTLTRESGPGRSEEEIQEILDRNKGAMYRIYNRALRQDSTLQDKLVMSITIAPSGRVTGCTIIDSELKSASLEKQLIRLIKGIHFGNKAGVPVVTTKVPIEFFPQ
jgi:outer membrane biosynthesis protein TonB